LVDEGEIKRLEAELNGNDSSDSDSSSSSDDDDSDSDDNRAKKPASSLLSSISADDAIAPLPQSALPAANITKKRKAEPNEERTPSSGAGIVKLKKAKPTKEEVAQRSGLEQTGKWVLGLNALQHE
jgi:hypothetical protein